MILLRPLLDVALALAAAAAPEPKTPPALESSLSLASLARDAAQPGANGPGLAVGYAWADISADGAGSADDGASTLNVTSVLWGRLGESLLGGVDVGVLYTRFDAQCGPDSYPNMERLYVLLGGRLGLPLADAKVIPYVRGGASFQLADPESFWDETGLGWYAGGGLQWRFQAGWSLSPEVVYVYDPFCDGLNLTFFSISLGYNF